MYNHRIIKIVNMSSNRCISCNNTNPICGKSVATKMILSETECGLSTSAKCHVTFVIWTEIANIIAEL